MGLFKPERFWSNFDLLKSLESPKREIDRWTTGPVLITRLIGMLAKKDPRVSHRRLLNSS